MSLLSFIFTKQTHKNSRGYYINHDNLLPLSKEYRQRLIFYFIAQQLPQKLHKEDRQAYEFERNKLDHITTGVSLAVGVLGIMTKPFVTPKRNYLFLNFLSYFLRFVVYSGLTYSVANAISQQRFVAKNPTLIRLGQRYKFTIYDFAVAKKESRLRALKNQLESQYVMF